MTEPKINIPKFGSFRPKPAADEGKTKEEVITRSRSRTDANDKDKEDRRRRHGRHRSRSREWGQRGVNNAETRPREKYESQDIFVVDRKGDEKNLLYGSVHRYSVPPFHRFGGGSVLGLPPDMKIDRDFGDEKGIVIRNLRESKSKYREKYVFSKIERDRPRLLKIRPQAVAEETGGQEADFVPLQAPRGKKRKRHGHAEGESSGSEREERDYRSIYGKIEDTQPVDDDFQYATDSESSGSEAGRTLKMDPSIQRQNVELSRKVENSPHDIDAWLALIDHQDVLIRAQNGRRTTNAETRSTADIKLHMYEKALQNARSLPDRERLLLGIMKEGAKIWEVKAQADRWEQISKDNIDSLVLWMSYLNFKQSTFSTFQYEEVKEVFIQRIKLLSEASNIAEPANVVSLYHQLIYVLLRLTLFMRESGYAELAVATWQGLLEVNFSAPHQPLTKLDRVKLFKDFWESEVPRIGEEGALGWCHFAEQEGTTDVPDVLVDSTQDDLDNKDIFRTWASAERLRSKNILPARTMDEVVEDDPFRVILFSDIEDYLTSLPPNPALYRSLLNAFLLFCRLPPMPPIDDEGSHGWATDAFVGSELLECESEWIKIKYMKTPHSQSTDTHAEDKNAEVFSISPESKFKDNVWFQLDNSRERCGGDNGPLFYHWIRNSLRQLIRNYFQENLAEYYLAFEYRNEPETIKKTAKGLLKQHPACLRLYNSYAMIEWSRGNKEISNAAFAAAIAMSNSMSQADLNKDSIVLWKTWIWACLEERDNGSALKHLLSIASGSPSSDITLTPAVLLQSKHHLISNRDFLLSSGNFRQSVIYAECLAILEHLTSTDTESTTPTQGNITAALSTYTSFSSILSSRPNSAASHQYLLESATRLLYHHTVTGPFRPSLIREYLTHFLTLFPQNTTFLTLYLYNESRLRIDNRVRSILLSTILTSQNDVLSSRIFAIKYEIDFGTIYSARSAFEHALSSEKSRGSPGLWRWYILFCLETPRFRGMAKEVWYRALKACPWPKQLYLTGFENLGMGEMEFRELRSTWRVMGEKELRVHVDLEERFEEIGEEDKNGGSLKYR